MKPRVLVVEDEEAISEPLGEHLAREGFDPSKTEDPIYFYDGERGEYVPMTGALYERIHSGSLRL